MSDTQQMLERAWRQAPQPEHVMDSLIRRRARRERNRRIGAAVIGIGLALVIFASVVRTLVRVEPADQPTDKFARVQGWIAYGDKEGIWALDPSRAKTWDERSFTDPDWLQSRVQLSDQGGEPLAWSGDGTKLLIWRWVNIPGPDNNWAELVVLSGDGTETTVTRLPELLGWFTGGSISPDGSTVVYAVHVEDRRSQSTIYVIDAEGGSPHVLISRRHPPNYMAYPTFSPDGDQIAYVDGGGDYANKIFVMNADGSGSHVVFGKHLGILALGPFGALSWSPDGSRLAFSADASDPAILIGSVDGSGRPTGRIPNGSNPHWSPDGSQITYLPTTEVGPIHGLGLGDADGTNVRVFTFAGSGPWNPLPLSAHSDRSPTATGSRVGPFVYAAILLGVVVILMIGKRTQRQR